MDLERLPISIKKKKKKKKCMYYRVRVYATACDSLTTYAVVMQRPLFWWFLLLLFLFGFFICLPVFIVYFLVNVCSQTAQLFTATQWNNDELDHHSICQIC